MRKKNHVSMIALGADGKKHAVKAKVVDGELILDARTFGIGEVTQVPLAAIQSVSTDAGFGGSSLRITTPAERITLRGTKKDCSTLAGQIKGY